MFRRIYCILVIAALVLFIAPAPASAAALTPSNSTTTPTFQLNLARRISTRVAQLREKRSPSKTSRFGLAGIRRRTFSDELLDMIKGVSNAFASGASASASASPKPHALAGKPSPSVSWASHAASRPTSGPSQSAHQSGPSQSAHKPGPSPSAHHPGASQAAAGASQAAAATTTSTSPSAGVSQHAAAAQPSALYDSRGKAARVWDFVRRAIQEEPWETLDSRLLCPVGETACPIFPRMGTYECLDTRVELESCGGCTSKGLGEDCTTIRGAQGVTCEAGACHVYTCQPGYVLDSNYRRDAGGKGRCRKVRAAQPVAAAEVAFSSGHISETLDADASEFEAQFVERADGSAAASDPDEQ